MDTQTRHEITMKLATYARKEGILPDDLHLKVNRFGEGYLEECSDAYEGVIVVFNTVEELMEFFEEEGV